MQRKPPPQDERRIHSDRLSQARNGWLPAAIRESRRLEQRERSRRLLLAYALRAGTVVGAS